MDEKMDELFNKRWQHYFLRKIEPKSKVESFYINLF
jgi:hypothetical protein